VPELVAHLNDASARLDTTSQRLSAASPAGPPATIADIRHELDVLKMDLSQHEPDGIASLGGTTRDGFSEIGTKLDRLSEQLDGMKKGGASSASPPATRQAYPKRTS
jgi:hypothetical protein